MLTQDFDYDLPSALIAQEPIEPRDASRLLVLHRPSGRIEHRLFCDILGYLRRGDLLVVNETRVIPARVQARKVPTGGKVELLLLAKTSATEWEALVRGRRVRVGQRLTLGDDSDSAPKGTVTAVTPAGGRLIQFDRPIEADLGRVGSVPLPPYIHRALHDPERYQTVYARSEGSVAAPTAGLHFTPGLIARTQEMGVEWARVVLDIGLDTFRPVREERVEEHQIHTEQCRLTADTAQRVNRAKREGRRVIAVGTTSVRVLETAVQSPPSRLDGEARTERVPGDNIVRPWEGPTDLYIYPGYRFRVVDALITNFHLPRSSLLMLVSAFASREQILSAYSAAVRERYRFYSFGDAMLIL
ncbi:MAG: tRNA preQ1(34) S-adenosylmethionine ribosyltransferase-isomerase QueA [Anaerolineae bacterium]|nr:tRNA preQ1(34) S-adenosylmethionine ribosyltransferase-isomerase QueA [Anaerolineae bacterium]